MLTRRSGLIAIQRSCHYFHNLLEPDERFPKSRGIFSHIGNERDPKSKKKADGERERCACLCERTRHPGFFKKLQASSRVPVIQ